MYRHHGANLPPLGAITALDATGRIPQERGVYELAHVARHASRDICQAGSPGNSPNVGAMTT